MDLKDFVKVYDNVLSPEICNRIISEFEARKNLVKHYDTDFYKFDQLDLNETDLQPLAVVFARQVIPYIQKYCDDLGVKEFVKIKGFEDVRIKKYLKNSDYEFKTHVDVDDKATAVRYLIFILYLNDNNGETKFPLLNYSYKPKQGSMIMFPPFWMYPHSGGIPTDNDKYIMMSCLHYT